MYPIEKNWMRFERLMARSTTSGRCTPSSCCVPGRECRGPGAGGRDEIALFRDLVEEGGLCMRQQPGSVRGRSLRWRPMAPTSCSMHTRDTKGRYLNYCFAFADAALHRHRHHPRTPARVSRTPQALVLQDVGEGGGRASLQAFVSGLMVVWIRRRTCRVWGQVSGREGDGWLCWVWSYDHDARVFKVLLLLLAVCLRCTRWNHRCMSVLARAQHNTHTHTHTHTYIHTYIHTCMHTSIHPYIHTSILYPLTHTNVDNIYMCRLFGAFRDDGGVAHADAPPRQCCWSRNKAPHAQKSRRARRPR